MAVEIVYIIGTSIGAPVKIGRTKNLEGRLRSFQTGTPNSYVVFRVMPGGRDLETWFHQRFVDSHISREWFEYDPEMLTIQSPVGPISKSTGLIDRSTYAGTMTAFLRERYGQLRDAMKLIARDAGATERAAKSWIAGDHGPTGEKLINLMAADPELERRIAQLVAERRAARGGE